MKLFISWSGDRSKLLAEALHEWIPKVINAVEPWLSADDIAPGQRWSSEIAGQLEKTSFGIICLTRENLNAPWILFEAGALSKFVANSSVVPFLLDNKPSEIQGPLAQFQALQVYKGNVNKLLVSINRAVALADEKSLSESALADSFEVWWSRLEKKIYTIPKTTVPEQASSRNDRDVLDEILVLVRGLTNEARAPVGKSDAEKIVDVLFSPKNLQNKAFIEFFYSLSKEDVERISISLLSKLQRGRAADYLSSLYHTDVPLLYQQFLKLKNVTDKSDQSNETSPGDVSPEEKS